MSEMGEMETFTEHDLRERLWAGGDGLNPASLTALADDALRQARRRQRALRTAATLSTALVVAGVGTVVGTLAAGSGRSAAVSGSPTAQAQHGPVKLAAPILLAIVKSATEGACTTTGGYNVTSDAVVPGGVWCFKVDSTHEMTVRDVARIYATPTPSAGDRGRVDGPDGSPEWQIPVTLLPADKAAFTRLTTAAINKQIVFIVDGQVVSAATPIAPLTGGEFSLSGYPQRTANALLKEVTG